MKILGLDVSSVSTGWGLIEDDKLIEFGKINPMQKMSHAQKLHLFDVELTKLMAKHKPDLIAIEDVVHVASISTMKILARFNGIAIKVAYSHNQKEPTLVEPTKWKVMLDGCTGSAKKAQVQLAICKIFNLISDDRYSFYSNKIDAIFADNKSIDTDLRGLKDEMKKAKKKNMVDRVLELEKLIDGLTDGMERNKKQVKKKFDDALSMVSLEIYTETGLNEDEADALGIALFLKNSN